MEDDDNQLICRMCMQSDSILDWHEELFDFSGVSYKDCYYKYTQLEDIVADPFPQLLCGTCSADLQSFHLLIERALETQKLFEQNLEIVDIRNVPSLLEGSRSEPDRETECVYLLADNEEESLKPLIDESGEISEEAIIEIVEPPRSGRKKLKCSNSVLNNSSKTEEIKEDGITARKSSRIEGKFEKGKDKRRSQPATAIPDEEKIDNLKSKRNTPVMCSYCSKIIHNVYYLKMHEQTHKEDRTREKCCPKCGLKTFTSAGLYNHMKIHEKNREKKFKCEFCDKAFFDRGACNIHRRIHLGQMVKCPICPKEYYRQIDLDKHMASHSHAQSKVKYVVHCKECDKQISSAKFNAHRAAHMNDPLMRCTVCEKDFFCRKSCTRHMQRVHKKTKDNYDDITMYYEKYRPRLSRILREQQEEVKTEML